MENKWKYMVKWAQVESPVGLQKWLNEYGLLGWELATIYPVGETIYCVFKKLDNGKQTTAPYPEELNQTEDK